jgi:hypothetical protein
MRVGGLLVVLGVLLCVKDGAFVPVVVFMEGKKWQKFWGLLEENKALFFYTLLSLDSHFCFFFGN